MAEYVIFESNPATNYGQVTHNRNSVGSSDGSSQLVVPDETGLVRIEYNASASSSPGAGAVAGIISLKFELNGSVVYTRTLLSFNLPPGPQNQSTSGTVFLTSAEFGVDGFDEYYIFINVGSGSGTFSVNAGANVYHSLQYPKFLTKLDRPVMWRGWPFLLSALFDDTFTVQTELQAGSDVSSNFVTAGKQVVYDINQILTNQTPETFEVELYKDGFAGGTDPALSETLTIELQDACQNPILLVGRNSLGGALCWLFEVSQEEDYNYSNDIKRKRQVLSGAGLTKNQWDSLQDFITTGEIYRENIVELLPTTDKTTKRIDQQLYVVDQEGNKIGVIAIPSRNRTQTKLQQHYFEIEIEYPDEF